MSALKASAEVNGKAMVAKEDREQTGLHSRLQDAEAWAANRPSEGKEQELAATLAKIRQDLEQANQEVAAARRDAKDAAERAERAEGQLKTAQANAGDAAATLSAARARGMSTETDLAAVRGWAEAGPRRATATLSGMQFRVKELEEAILMEKTKADGAEAALCAARADQAREQALVQGLVTQVREKGNAALAERAAAAALRSTLSRVQREVELTKADLSAERAKAAARVGTQTAAVERAEKGEKAAFSEVGRLEQERQSLRTFLGQLRDVLEEKTAALSEMEAVRAAQDHKLLVNEEALVAARNRADHLEAAMKKQLERDYAALERLDGLLLQAVKEKVEIWGKNQKLKARVREVEAGTQAAGGVFTKEAHDRTERELREALAIAKQEAQMISVEYHYYAEDMEDSLAQAQRRVRALERVIGQTVEGQKRLLERSEAAAAQADRSEVETLSAELGFWERQSLCRERSAVAAVPFLATVPQAMWTQRSSSPDSPCSRGARGGSEYSARRDVM